MLMAYMLLLGLRFIDMGLVESAAPNSFPTLRDYVESLLTTETRASRDAKARSLRKRIDNLAEFISAHESGGSGGKASAAFNNEVYEARVKMEALSRLIARTVPRNKQTWRYFGRVAASVAGYYLVLVAGFAFFVANPPKTDLPVMHLFLFNDAKRAVDLIVIGGMLYSVMQAAYITLFHLSSVLFDIPFLPLMDNPFISTSPRDFWSNRWNTQIKESLYRLSFAPVMSFLDGSSGGKRRGTASRGRTKASDSWWPWASSPRSKSASKTHAGGSKSGSSGARAAARRNRELWHTVVASMSAFALSALVHEYTVFVMLDRPTTLEQTAFFLLHGAITVAQVVVGRACRTALRFDPFARVPAWAFIVLNAAVFLATSPLFFNPWFRENLLMKVSGMLMPPVLVNPLVRMFKSVM
nr:hypothetical protein HK105_003149 [Polyrhizophydium stewartii]